jgi:hypothetical protein
MKNLRIAAFLASIFIIICVVIIGCSGSGGGGGWSDQNMGSFSINVRSLNRSAIDELPPLNYVIKLVGPGPTQERFISDSEETQRFSVTPGRWTISVDALLVDGGALFGRGSVIIDIKPGPNEIISIPMRQIDGEDEKEEEEWNIEVTTWDQLKTRIEAAPNNDELVILLNSTTFDATNTIMVEGGKKITLTALLTVNIKRTPSSFSKQLFIVEGSSSELTLGEYSMVGSITIRGSEGDGTEMVSVNNGTLVLNNEVTLTGNNRGFEGFNGGAVVVNGGKFTMFGGSIQHNSVFGYGGGVFVGSGSTFEMHGGTISNNTANEDTATDTEGFGGGVYVAQNGTFLKTGGTIDGNSADQGGDQVSVFLGEDGYPVYLHRNEPAGPNNDLDSTILDSAGGWDQLSY